MKGAVGLEKRYAPDGQPVVGEGDACPYWQPGEAPAITATRECWFCRWSDFRENLETHKSESLCRNPANKKREREAV